MFLTNEIIVRLGSFRYFYALNSQGVKQKFDHNFLGGVCDSKSLRSEVDQRAHEFP